MITLIIPPSPFLLDERVFPSLGLLKIAAVLEQITNVSVLDLSGIKNYTDVLQIYLKNNQSDTYCITSTTPQLPYAVIIKNYIKQYNNNYRVILGGPHVTLVYAAFKNNPSKRAIFNKNILEENFDCLVSGDGEKAIFESLKPDVKFVDGDDPKQNYFLTNIDYERLPFPNRNLIDLNSYHYTIEGKKATSIIAQLGCPFNCGFCGGRLSNSLRRIRTRSSINILSEIEYLYKTYNIEGFMFYDDELNVNKNFEGLLIDLIKLQKKLNKEFRFRGFIKSELFNQTQANLMYDAGFRWVLCGFESGNDRILENINKKATYADNSKVINYCKNAKLKIKALMSIGHPGESADTIEDTKNFLINHKVDDFDCTVITPYPGTPYYDNAVEISDDVYKYTVKKTNDSLYSTTLNYMTISNYYKGIPGKNYISYVYTDYLTSEQIVNLRDNLETNVRKELNIPYNTSAASLLYEHSMGQTLPAFINKLN